MFLPAHWVRLCRALLCRSPLTFAYASVARQPSSALKTRDAFWGMPKRGLAFLLANVMFWQPMWA
ncbi:hypothetical protein, partial [Pseudomonas sp. URIL14HWK12:I7]|uniref:hypothetical protein n=1 Tax=Pseudomonas sp. URIL14HWK12:I7 TaxID=1283285 RepID=UPI0012DD8EF5